ncbi:AraC-like DNA-binding protein [Aquimarina sp. MAR_2010_214]|uniref:helix-turn-helix domain-containing protein n=1 Tax=Aquimarina sp. MAR_2010_214 TaxID=1250026 RepID=UPI000C7002E0|nr:AraC family transcriptional regulator [Aquimarina sp. MAR_2010_214]PKV49231.1 AraC-like DNA-binding protein [Aquimarina sp. MAR_2010_214]
MGLKLCLEDVQDIMFESGKHQYDIDVAGTHELNISYNYKNFRGWYKEIVLDNFKIGYGSSTLSQKTTLFFEFNEETVEMHFTLQGSSSTSIEALPTDFSIGNNTHNIFYCNDIKGKMEWNSKDFYIFEINLQPKFFEQYLPDDGLFDTFKKIIQNKEIGFLSPHNHPITPPMLIIIYEIINCSWKNKYRQLFLEAKVLELLLLQLEQIRLCDVCLVNINTSKTIIDKMYYAKEIVLAKLNNPMCLSDLARVVSTNECTLKKEFKNVFGTTVFGYIRDTKMEQAKKMLLNQKLSVNEVSDRIGYKNPQHFSTAFKRKFGVSPSRIKG